jgi:threonyl-tRNA synthetase
MIQLTKYIWNCLGMTEFEVSLSTGDDTNRDKYLGDKQDWDEAEKALEEALRQENIKYTRYPGEAAFYGPKADFLFKDSIGRQWQCSTIQVDFNLPMKFHMEYIDENGNKVQPIMLHRALLGSVERSLGILIEHYAGAFPLWLSPVQVSIIPISDQSNDYAKSVSDKLEEQGMRVELDNQADSMQKRIRNAEKQKIPYMLVVGQKEQQNQTISVRARGRQDLGVMTLDDFLGKTKKEIEDKA